MSCLLFAIIVLLSGGSAFAQKQSQETVQSLPLFFISKDVNKNRVMYDATVDSKCVLNVEKPVKIYWLMGTGKTEDLNFFERRAFPINYVKRSASEATGDIKALKDKQLRFPITLKVEQEENGRCAAIASAPGVARILSVHLSNFDGMNPRNVSVQGLDRNGIAIDKPIQRDGVSLLQFEDQEITALAAFDL